MSGHYFLSYSRRDQDTALRLAGDLRAVGADIWIDQVDIRPSERWDRTVEAAVRDCAGMVLVLSPRSVASDHVLDEVAVALSAGKPVIPVLIEACETPLRLSKVQHIDATVDFEGAVTRCRKAMDRAARQPSPAAPAPAADRSPAAIPAEVTAAMGVLLTPYLGPISPLLAQDESQGAASAADLADRLAARIPNEADRAAFRAAAARVRGA